MEGPPPTALTPRSPGSQRRAAGRAPGRFPPPLSRYDVATASTRRSFGHVLNNQPGRLIRVVVSNCEHAELAISAADRVPESAGGREVVDFDPDGAVGGDGDVKQLTDDVALGATRGLNVEAVHERFREPARR